MPNKGKKKKRSAESQREQPKRQPAAAIAARAKNKLLSSDERLQAITQLADLVCKGGTAFKTAVALLKDTAEPSAVRLAALQALQTAAFGVVAFEPCQADYVEALRSLMDDPDAEVRQRVLGSLTRKEDAVAQQRLIDGLRSPDQALVPAEKALQLLSADVHTEAYDVAREILEKPPSTAAKREAVRLLAADPSAAPVLERILRDKSEYAEVRQVSAAALNTVDPEALYTAAKEILKDESEYPEIQATSLSALTQFAPEQTQEVPELRERIRRLASDKSELLRKTANAYLDKHGN